MNFAKFPRPEDCAAYDWVFAEVKRQGGGGEAVYAYSDKTGDKIAGWYAPQAGANLDPAAEAALRAGEPVVIHHNHPSNGSFIQLDLLTLIGMNPHHPGLPGLAAMWAHGNGGPRYRIALADPGHATSIKAADQLLTSWKGQLSQEAGGHEIFNSGWHHLVDKI